MLTIEPFVLRELLRAGLESARACITSLHPPTRSSQATRRAGRSPCLFARADRYCRLYPPPSRSPRLVRVADCCILPSSHSDPDVNIRLSASRSTSLVLLKFQKAAASRSACSCLTHHVTREAEPYALKTLRQDVNSACTPTILNFPHASQSACQRPRVSLRSHIPATTAHPRPVARHASCTSIAPVFPYVPTGIPATSI